MRELIVPIVLQIAGIAVIITEFLVPSAGLLAVLSGGLIIGSIVLVYVDVSSAAATAFIIADAVILPVIVVLGIKMIAKSPLSLRNTLSRAEGVTSQSENPEQFLGKEGTTTTPLRPAGLAVVNGKRIDVVSRGEFIEKNTPVQIILVTGNQLVVKKKE